MDIVDAQIHFGPGKIDETLAAMDALGIRGAVIDEYWFRGSLNEPKHDLRGGGYRVVAPTAELATLLHPERFSYLLRVHPADPEYGSIIRQMRDAPGCRALRVDPGMARDSARAFAEGAYDHLFAAAGDAGLAIFIFNPDQPEAIARAAAKFPSTRMIIDHCGLFSNTMRATLGGGLPALDEEAQLAMFDRVLNLERFPNVALKWAHAETMFGAPAWPGRDLWPFLRRAISSLGAERIMWASDFSASQGGGSWAQLLYGQIADPDLTEAEREWVFGRTLRSWLTWDI